MPVSPSTHVPPPGLVAPDASETRTHWIRLVAGLFVAFGVFHVSATILQSDRGQHGLVIGILVVTATAAVDRFLLCQPFGSVVRHLGLGPPQARGIVAASGVAALLLAVALLVSARGLTPGSYPGWTSLLPGLFAQAGVAEEVLFRRYLFGHIRVGRTFRRAAGLSMFPFVAVHLILFLSMPWPIALASVLLAVVISFPLAHLFELGGGTIWAPAIVHFVIQGTVKVVVFPDGTESFAIAWMAASAVVPLLVFTIKAPTVRGHKAECL